ncbi:hypothetical protein OSC52_15350 [Clostridium pasteurianum]|uniref:hypothetical protein n=1 Tax=Clostridium pasteurianum TaxID=1501 RepID=UPI002260C055|nr:hypothetical protein [Clostridium pasteurianum]UZW13212.1 hypothetical protein OSC52_15350 [Clostridium pasteurianum]
MMFDVKNKETGEVTKVYSINYDSTETMFLIYDLQKQGWYWDYADRHVPIS